MGLYIRERFKDPETGKWTGTAMRQGVLVEETLTYYSESDYKRLFTRDGKLRSTPLAEEVTTPTPITKVSRKRKDKKPAVDGNIISRNVVRIVLWLEGSHPTAGNQWQLQVATDTSIPVTILDKAFLANVSSGAVRVDQGDALLADVEFAQVARGDKVVMEYSLLKVVEHKAKEEQLTLFTA